MEDNLSSDRNLHVALRAAIMIQSVSVLAGAMLWGDVNLRLAIMMICGPFGLFSTAIALRQVLRRRK